MFVLPIKSTYVSHWGSWEAIRELVQNAKDEEDEHGHKMTVKYDHGWLHLGNIGADLARSALLLGQTSKASRDDLRGEFGEGLDLALLAGVRAGYDIRIHTKTEIWIPTIEYVKKFDALVLVVRTRAKKTEGIGVEARIKMPIDDWVESRKLFRFLVDDAPEFNTVVEDGTILTHPDRQGQIYVKGIYCTTMPNMEFGYDLKHVKTDRDRRMVDTWDLRWKLAAMLKEGVAKDPGKLAHVVYQMLKDKSEEVLSLEYNSSDEFAEAMAELFKSEHGNESIPVGGMAESKQLDHLGAQGIVVSDTLKKVLERKIKSAADVKLELATASTAEYSWRDLEVDERAVLSEVTTLVHEATAQWRGKLDLPPILDRLHVVDFKLKELLGTCEGDSGDVKIARRLLVDNEESLIVLVHEEAHALSLASDGEKRHVDMVERIWAQLFFAKE